MNLEIWKWLGTSTSIAGAFALACGAKWALIGYILFTVGSWAWFWVGVRCKDKALKSLNAAFLACDALGLYNWF